MFNVQNGKPVIGHEEICYFPFFARPLNLSLKGFELPLVLVTFFFKIGCGAVMNNTLKSPRYPSKYPGRMDCVYRVPIPQGMTLKLTFLDFSLENRYSGRW